MQKKRFCARNTIGKTDIKINSKNDKNQYTKHHKIDQILIIFDGFYDVWYADFYQFLNLF